ncbi:MAG: hypothetical protein WDN00_13435 [Limisphaerales bacterium]
MGALIGQKKLEEAEVKKSETRNLGDEISALEEQCQIFEKWRQEKMLELPNLPHESVPQGKSAADNPEIRIHGCKSRIRLQAKVSRRIV